MKQTIRISRFALVSCTIIFLNLLFISSINAQTWQNKNIPTSETQRSVYFISPNEGWSAGYNGTILHTIDYGANWSLQTSNTTEGFLAIRFMDKNIGWVGAGRIILRTIDGGKSWTDINADPSINKFRNSLFPVSAKMAWAPANSVNVSPLTRWFSRYTIEDNGTTTEEDFDVNIIESLSSFYGIYFTDLDNGWSVGTGGQIIKISNGSTASPSFSSQTSNTTKTLYGVFMLDANNGWIVGSGGTILKTINGGTDWSPLTSGTTTTLREVYFTDSNNGWAVGDSGLILATEDGGTNWSVQASEVTTTLWSVFFNENGFIAGGDFFGGDTGVILRYKKPAKAMPWTPLLLE
jgi:photosystem II stability/assembly factor-like uncharacterized protein